MREAQAEPSTDTRSLRLRLFALLCIVAVVAVVGYTVYAMRRSARPRPAAAADTLLASPPPRPYLMVRSTAPDDTWRKLMLAPLDAPGGPAYPTSLVCERAYFSMSRGVCLVDEDGATTRHYAEIFDEHFARLHKLPLTGLPSRVRVSPNGRRAGITVFERGHSYAEAGFSTRTTIVDTIAGRDLGHLEQYAITRDGARFHAVDFNFWGVTFAQDSNKFFATLASGDVKYLIEGDVDGRRGRVVRTGVECPSLSPDNTRIAYKHRLPAEGRWQLRVYDLRTGAELALTGESRSVDDQVDWLDNERVMYHITGSRGADIWVLRVDNREEPKMLRQYAYSPAVVL